MNEQLKISKLLEKLTIDTFPRTLMLLGEKGCGKHMLLKIISDKFDLKINDITGSISLDTIQQIQLTVEPAIYVIDCNNIKVRDENIILKFLEEPLKNSFIILLCEYKEGLLPTILNRCQIWQFESYSERFLSTFFDDNIPEDKKKLILHISRTPGDIKYYQYLDLQPIYDLCVAIFTKMQVANVANALSIKDKIAFKNEKDKFDVQTFFRMLLYVCREMFLNNNISSKIYIVTLELLKNLNTYNADKQMLFENYILKLKGIDNLWI